MQKENPIILHLETGGDICSVALSQGYHIVGLREDDNGKEHSRLLSLFIDSLLSEKGFTYNELDAVALSMGPGSYTGLRIGVATAKGICYGLNKPLIAVNSLHSLAAMCLRTDSHALYCPMIDARRLEVYMAIYNANLEIITPTEAKIIDEYSFGERLNAGERIIFFGNGAEKCKALIKHDNASFVDIKASARGMVDAAMRAYLENDFVDTAYFEPLYLKDFVVTKKKN